jgi:nitrogen fixation protein NifU and related proteins
MLPGKTGRFGGLSFYYELFDLTGEDVLKAIGIFPKEEAHCAFLAVKTMQEAVNAYLVKQVQQK